MAITSSSTVQEVLADERAAAIMRSYTDLFSPDNEMLGPCATMKIKTLIRFPQAGLSKEAQAEICAKLDALDA